MGKSGLKIKELALEGKLPSEFKSLNQKRDYFGCVLVDFRFRGIPQRVGQQAHYVFGGRAEVTFNAYALNSDEIAKIDEELEKSDINDVLSLVEGVTTESLEQLKYDIEYFLEEEKKEEKKFQDASNPFIALIGGYNSKGEKPKKDEKGEKKISVITSDSWIEKTYLREIANENAQDLAFKIFDVYKKSHGMVSYT